jgi:hypothetical protein
MQPIKAVMQWIKCHLDAYLATAKVYLEQNVEGGSLREPVLSRSVVQSSQMSLFFNQVNQKTESRPSWD